MPKYWMNIVFRSNERPWQSRHEAHRGITTDDEAIEWARCFEENMGQYDITLFRDDVVLPFREEADENIDELN